MKANAIAAACLGMGLLAFALGRADVSTWLAAAVVIGALNRRTP